MPLWAAKLYGRHFHLDGWKYVPLSLVGMEQISTIRALIGLWPSRSVFADALGVPVERVHKWAAANAIPAKYHLAVLRSAAGLGLAVSADLIVRLHAQDDAATGAAA